ncbi:MAG: OmpH family outer membrane protein [Crocinitomicaceae bacterium]|jgi:outer membrane protein|nr:OmpH family outer membrane protein [Crocinitomicaceae bacterium]MDP4723423.1 OmpH family outer membrane protein [Crocinitomicaceae bacterium]MDP4739403.1 OmpH family outer membrane protein [Crocinitomicaceae bacterium]MDP4805922.1 OmpH family outer membrane protein [Crocinitomicaceae bacterium]MDP4867877.1 OmpH family outer membrane protein [Crocinitomicaceae bacterium]
MKNVLLGLFVVIGFSTFAQTKIGHVDSQKLLDTMPSRKEAIKKLDSMKTSGMQELQLMDADFQKAYQDYTVNQANKSPAERQIIEGRLMQKQQMLEATQASLEEGLQIMSEELNKPILDRVQKSIDIVSERKKLNYVLDVSATMYSKGGIDITSEVIVELLLLDAAATKK